MTHYISLYVWGDFSTWNDLLNSSGGHVAVRTHSGGNPRVFNSELISKTVVNPCDDENGGGYYMSYFPGDNCRSRTRRLCHARVPHFHSMRMDALVMQTKSGTKPRIYRLYLDGDAEQRKKTLEEIHKTFENFAKRTHKWMLLSIRDNESNCADLTKKLLLNRVIYARHRPGDSTFIKILQMALSAAIVFRINYSQVSSDWGFITQIKKTIPQNAQKGILESIQKQAQIVQDNANVIVNSGDVAARLPAEVLHAGAGQLTTTLPDEIAKMDITRQQTAHYAAGYARQYDRWPISLAATLAGIDASVALLLYPASPRQLEGYAINACRERKQKITGKKTNRDLSGIAQIGLIAGLVLMARGAYTHFVYNR